MRENGKGSLAKYRCNYTALHGNLYKERHYVRDDLAGGQGGIRTHGELAPSPVFKTGAFDHSATCPL